MAEEEFSAVGWDALDAALAKVYGEQEPKHYGTVIKFALGGPDPLDGVSIYRSENDRPHWHYVTYGLSELYHKESEDPENSGFGFELTMRLLAHPEEDEPPIWVIALLQNLARYVFRSGNVFMAGHYVDCNGPIELGSSTDLKAVLFATDPELPAIDTANGRVEFLQVVGITLDELSAAKRWNTNGLLKIIARADPFYINDLSRKSILSAPDVVREIEAGTEKEGSSTGMLFITALDWKLSGMIGKSCNLSFGATAVPDLKAILPARIARGSELILVGPEKQVHVMAGDKLEWSNEGPILILKMTAAEAKNFADGLPLKAGSYSLLPNLFVQVSKSEIKDAEGKVVEVVG